MNKFLIISVVALLAILASVQAVYKGQNVRDRALIPWYAQVETIKNNGDELLCGGSILQLWAILTTANCLGDLVLNKTVAYVGYLNYKKGTKVLAKTLIPHKNYSAATNEYNLGVIITQTRLVESTTIKAITLPVQGNAYADSIVQMFGMGMIGMSDFSNVVRVGTSKVLWNGLTTVTPNALHISDMTVSKSTTNDIAAMCDGDEGGPLMVNGTSVQIGIYKFTSLAGDCEVHPDTDPTTIAYTVFERLPKQVAYLKTITDANIVY